MTQRRDRDKRRGRALRPLAFMALVTALAAVPTVAFAGAGTAAGSVSPSAAVPAVAPAAAPTATVDLGPNVLVFDPSMPQAEIQAKVDAIAAEQVPNEMGSARYALLFKPGTYGTAAKPLNFQVGYYTEVAGLGQNPGDVVVNGSIYVRNQCSATGHCIALNNFWRSMSNLTINVNTPDFGCYSGQFWAVSQAAPLRRVHVKGLTTLMDYCTGPSYRQWRLHRRLALRPVVISGSQQQFFMRNSALNGWSNGVWNQVFSGTEGAPAECFPPRGLRRPVHDGRHDLGEPREAVPLRRRAGAYQRLRARGRDRHAGVSWADGPTPGPVDPAHRRSTSPGRPTRAQAINSALARGPEPAAHPGRLPPRPDGQGQAGGHRRARSRAAEPDPDERPGRDERRRRAGRRHRRHHLRRRPGQLAGAAAGRHQQAARARATARLSNAPTRPPCRTSSSASAGPTSARPRSASRSTATTSSSTTSGPGAPTTATASAGRRTPPTPGVVVNGDHVTATGLFVEHYQKTEVIWNGEHGDGDVLPERDALRPAEPGGLDVGPRQGAATRPCSSPRRHALHRHGHGVLQLLQPGHRHLRRQRVRGARRRRACGCTTC